MMYIDRKNPPPIWGEMRKLEMEEVMKKGRVEVAKKMLKEGLAVELIAKITELPVEKIQKLQ